MTPLRETHAFLAGRDAVAQTTYSANTTISSNRTANGIRVSNNAALTSTNGATLTSTANADFSYLTSSSWLIENGGGLNVTGDITLGSTNSPTTAAAVAGSNSRLTSTSLLYVGNNAATTLPLSEGGTVAVNSGSGTISGFTTIANGGTLTFTNETVGKALSRENQGMVAPPPGRDLQS